MGSNNSNRSVDDVWVLQEPETPMELFDLSSSRSSCVGTSVRSEQESVQPPRDFSPRNNLSYPLLSSNGNTPRPQSPGSPHIPARGQVTSLHELTEPFMAILRIGGLYFEFDEASAQRRKKSLLQNHNGPSIGKPTTSPLPSIYRARPRNLLSRLLCCRRGREPSESLSFSLCSLSLIVSCVDDARLIYAFYALWVDNKLTTLAFVVDNLVTIIWALQCLFVHCILMVMCYHKRFSELYDSWEDVRNTYPDSPKTAKFFDFNQKFRHKQKLLIFAGFAALLLNCYSLIGPLLIPVEVYEEFSHYVMFPFSPDNYAIKVLIVVAFIFRSFDYVFTAMLFLLLSDAIVLQFTLFYEDLSGQISKDGVLADASLLEWHRLKHTKLCALVRRVDAVFSPYVLIGLASGMFGILAQVYVIYDFLKREEMNVVTVLSYIYWSLLNLAQVLVILWCGSKVHVANMCRQEIAKLNSNLYTDKALLPLSKLYEIDQRTLSVQETQHLTVFLQKLSNCQTGFTALGIFTIDMTTILSLAGFYFTYQILLFQMRNDSSLDEKLKNITLPQEIRDGLKDFLNRSMMAISSSTNSCSESSIGLLANLSDILT